MIINPVHKLCLILSAALTVACGSINNDVIVRDRTREILHRTDLVSRYPELQLLNEAAILSAAAYDSPNSVTTTYLTEYCTSEKEIAFDPIGHGWVEDSDLPALPVPPEGVRLIDDLRYRVWVKDVGEGRKVAVLAFRGTQSRADWFSNLRWVTRVVPRVWDHYEQLVRIVPDLVAAIRQHHGESTTIIPVGHSLGGGLAQLAGYSSNGVVKTVYAFDPSSVTYYYGVDVAVRDVSRKGQSIYRVFEQGEALSYVRWLVKRFYPISHADARIVQVKFHLLNGGLVRNHSMRRFACAAMSVPNDQAAAGQRGRTTRDTDNSDPLKAGRR